MGVRYKRGLESEDSAAVSEAIIVVILVGVGLGMGIGVLCGWHSGSWTEATTIGGFAGMVVTVALEITVNTSVVLRQKWPLMPCEKRQANA